MARKSRYGEYYKGLCEVKSDYRTDCSKDKRNQANVFRTDCSKNKSIRSRLQELKKQEKTIAEE